MNDLAAPAGSAATATPAERRRALAARAARGLVMLLPGVAILAFWQWASGRLIREICEDYGGSSGGHGSMAGARLPLSGRANQRKALKRELVNRFLEAFGVADERPVSLLAAQDA